MRIYSDFKLTFENLTPFVRRHFEVKCRLLSDRRRTSAIVWRQENQRNKVRVSMQKRSYELTSYFLHVKRKQKSAVFVCLCVRVY